MGTGTSDASYRIFDRLHRRGIPTARLDLDDIGMAHPAPDDDPGNVRVKGAAMAACWMVFCAHGTQCLVVSAALDAAELVERVTSHIPDAD